MKAFRAGKLWVLVCAPCEMEMLGAPNTATLMGNEVRNHVKFSVQTLIGGAGTDLMARGVDFKGALGKVSWMMGFYL